MFQVTFNSKSVLTPSISIVFNNPKISKELILFAKKWDIKYTICTYKEAWIRTLKNLNDVGNYYYKNLFRFLA